MSSLLHLHIAGAAHGPGYPLHRLPRIVRLPNHAHRNRLTGPRSLLRDTGHLYPHILRLLPEPHRIPSAHQKWQNRRRGPLLFHCSTRSMNRNRNQTRRPIRMRAILSQLPSPPQHPIPARRNHAQTIRAATLGRLGSSRAIADRHRTRQQNPTRRNHPSRHRIIPLICEYISSATWTTFELLSYARCATIMFTNSATTSTFEFSR